MVATVTKTEEVLECHPKCGKCCGKCTCVNPGERPIARPNFIQRLKEDVQTVFLKDPAARSLIEVLTCYPGLHAIWLHRIAHALWARGLRFPARFLSHLTRWFTGIEIHPGATLGRRVFIDHGMGVVIGETAEVGDDVLIYKGVVLGGIALEKAKRHPTIGKGVVIGTNAIILGPIEIGENSQVGSGSVVIKPVPACATVVGVPGRVVKLNGTRCQLKPDLHHEQLPDVMVERVNRLTERLEILEAELAHLQAEREPAILQAN
ncbi:MAG: serine O-acetyltransferase [Anaerolineae bacterium]|nr:serine O-acetyltransferase [Anaerolineae bacterium]